MKKITLIANILAVSFTVCIITVYKSESMMCSFCRLHKLHQLVMMVIKAMDTDMEDKIKDKGVIVMEPKEDTMEDMTMISIGGEEDEEVMVVMEEMAMGP